MRKMEIICNMFENSQVHLIYICIEGVMQIFHFAGYNTKNKTFSTCYQHDLDLFPYTLPFTINSKLHLTESEPSSCKHFFCFTNLSVFEYYSIAHVNKHLHILTYMIRYWWTFLVLISYFKDWYKKTKDCMFQSILTIFTWIISLNYNHETVLIFNNNIK